MGAWYDSRWTHRVTITFNHLKVKGQEDLIDFPCYVVIQERSLLKARADGADFLFTSLDGMTKLRHEIRSWDVTNARLVAYVRLPRLSPINDTTIFLYYGNTTASDQQDIVGVWGEYSYVRHIGEDPTERTPSGPRGGVVSGSHFFQLQVKVLENLFGGSWFLQRSRKRDLHPAYRAWTYCNSLANSGGQLHWSTKQELHELALKWAQVMGNNISLVQATKGDIEHFELGQLVNYGDDKVRRRLQSVIPDHLQYLDVLAEFRCVGWHLSQGHEVSVSENPGWADFRIAIPGWELPVLADCKRLSKTPTKMTVKRLIEKANRQVKTVGQDAHGLVLLDASELTLSAVRQLSDDIAVEVLAIQDVVQRLLANHYTALSGVVLFWDELYVLCAEPRGRGAMMSLRTRSLVVRHSAPIRPLPQDPKPIGLSGEVSCFVRFADRKWT